MTKYNFLVLIFIFAIFSIAVVAAQGDESEELPPGMEIRKVGPASTVVVPKSLEIRNDDGHILLETVYEYVARRLFEMDERLAEIEAENKELRKETDTLREQMNEI